MLIDYFKFCNTSDSCLLLQSKASSLIRTIMRTRLVQSIQLFTASFCMKRAGKISKRSKIYKGLLKLKE